MTLHNKVYDFLNLVALVWLPAFGSLYLGLAQVWDLPNTDKVVNTVVLLDTFLGAVVRVSWRRYNQDDANFDGYLDSSGIDEDTGFPNLRMVIRTTPEQVLRSNTIRLKVGRAPDES